MNLLSECHTFLLDTGGQQPRWFLGKLLDILQSIWVTIWQCIVT